LIPIGDFDEAYVAVEEEQNFLPFVGGEAARIELCATAVKRCLGVAASAALDPWAAAQSAGIDVFQPEQIRSANARTLATLIAHSPAWSGGAIRVNDSWKVLLNPLHDRARQRSTLAEELTHIVMGHPPTRLDAQTGRRTYNDRIEEEAYAVGGAMLLPYHHLFWSVKRGDVCAALAQRYAVSEAFVSYRINRCGLRKMYAKASA
jgi:Zn-dependent peptidase ImmA (M78 family)